MGIKAKELEKDATLFVFNRFSLSVEEHQFSKVYYHKDKYSVRTESKSYRDKVHRYYCDDKSDYYVGSNYVLVMNKETILKAKNELSKQVLKTEFRNLDKFIESVNNQEALIKRIKENIL